MKAKASGIIFILTLIVPVMATWLFFNIQKNEIRRAVKHQIIEFVDRDQLVLLKFASSETTHKLKWKHSKEFEYKGEMYDVVDKTESGDSVYYWCWWDHEETLLNKQVRELVSIALGHNQANKKTQQKLVDFFKSLYCTDKSIDIYTENNFLNHSGFYEIHYQSISFSPPTDPPKVS